MLAEAVVDLLLRLAHVDVHGDAQLLAGVGTAAETFTTHSIDRMRRDGEADAVTHTFTH